MKSTQRRLKFRRVKNLRDQTGQKLHGCADDYPLEIDSKLKGKKELEIYLHEMIHYIHPKMEENDVVRFSIVITNTLWWEGYRKVDNSNDIPMQDGTI
jgi:hypothetical protein